MSWFDCNNFVFYKSLISSLVSCISTNFGEKLKIFDFLSTSLRFYVRNNSYLKLVFLFLRLSLLHSLIFQNPYLKKIVEISVKGRNFSVLPNFLCFGLRIKDILVYYFGSVLLCFKDFFFYVFTFYIIVIFWIFNENVNFFEL